MEELPQDHPGRVDAEEIHQAGLRASELTGQLLALGSRQARALQVLELGSVVEQSRSLLQRLLGDTITLRCELGAGLPRLKADRGQLEQVLVNLAVNARDAMAGRGRLTVRTALAPRDAVPADPGQGATVVPEDKLRARGAEAQKVLLPAKAGESILLHNHLWHRSGQTRTGRRRLGLSVCYMGAETRCLRKKRAPREFFKVFEALP